MAGKAGFAKGQGGHIAEDFLLFLFEKSTLLFDSLVKGFQPRNFPGIGAVFVPKRSQAGDVKVDLSLFLGNGGNLPGHIGGVDQSKAVTVCILYGLSVLGEIWIGRSFVGGVYIDPPVHEIPTA